MSRRSGNPAKRAAAAAVTPAGPVRRRCAYCGHKGTSPADQSNAGPTARYPHAPVRGEWPPICALRTPKVAAA